MRAQTWRLHPGTGRLVTLCQLVVICVGPLAAQKGPGGNFLPLQPAEQSQAVGEALDTVFHFFTEYGLALRVTGEGETATLTSPKECDPEEYRLVRDASSVLQRSWSFRLLTNGAAYLGDLLDLARQGTPAQRRGAVWLLTRPGEKRNGIPPLVQEVLEEMRMDPDPLLRATLASLPHGDVVGARDPSDWARASWWRGFRPRGKLTPLSITFLEEALADESPWVRSAARQALPHVVDRLPKPVRARIEERAQQLDTDPTPWPHLRWPRPAVGARSVGWLQSLVTWVPLPFQQPRQRFVYRDAGVGNPGILVQRLEYLRTAVDNPYIPVTQHRQEPEPELRSAACLTLYKADSTDDAAAGARLKLLDDGDRNVRLAAQASFDAGSGFHTPAALVPGLQEHIERFLASQDPWECRGAVALARGLMESPGAGGMGSWALQALVTPPGEELAAPHPLAAFPADHHHDVIRTLLVACKGELPAELRQRLGSLATAWDADLPRSPASLLWLARDLDPRAGTALRALLQQGVKADQKAISVLCEGLSEEDPRDETLRRELPQALGGLSGNEAASLRQGLETYLAQKPSAPAGAAAQGILDSLP